MQPITGASSSNFLTGGFTSLPLPRKNDQTINDKFGQQIKKIVPYKNYSLRSPMCVSVCVGACVGERERERVHVFDSMSQANFGRLYMYF